MNGIYWNGILIGKTDKYYDTVISYKQPLEINDIHGNRYFQSSVIDSIHLIFEPIYPGFSYLNFYEHGELKIKHNPYGDLIYNCYVDDCLSTEHYVKVRLKMVYGDYSVVGTMGYGENNLDDLNPTPTPTASPSLAYDDIDYYSTTNNIKIIYDDGKPNKKKEIKQPDKKYLRKIILD